MSIEIDKTAKDRISELRKEPGMENHVFVLDVEGGGCSGFQYTMDFKDPASLEDGYEIFEGCVAIHETSIPFLIGSVIKFTQELIGRRFAVDNPNAVQGCGCGTSFSI